MSKEVKDTKEAAIKPKKATRAKGKKQTHQTPVSASGDVSAHQEIVVTPEQDSKQEPEVAVVSESPSKSEATPEQLLESEQKSEPVQDFTPTPGVELLGKVAETVQELKPVPEPTQGVIPKKKAGRKNKGLSTASALITLPEQDKERFTEFATKNSMSLSGLIRLAVNEYIHNHEWMK